MAKMTLERYQQRFNVGGPDECWEWQERGRDKDGYGILSWRENGKHFTVRAHRWGFQEQIRPLEPGEHVLHSCDNPPCQNPAHWSAGTNADNMADMKAKGRGTGPGRGEKHHSTTLTQAQVDEMRRLRVEEGWTHQRIADAFGTSRRNVGRILDGSRWKTDIPEQTQ
jgi:hypothetical protein